MPYERTTGVMRCSDRLNLRILEYNRSKQDKSNAFKADRICGAIESMGVERWRSRGSADWDDSFRRQEDRRAPRCAVNVRGQTRACAIGFRQVP